jgi:hypothetical protein
VVLSSLSTWKDIRKEHTLKSPVISENNKGKKQTKGIDLQIDESHIIGRGF